MTLVTSTPGINRERDAKKYPTLVCNVRKKTNHLTLERKRNRKPPWVMKSASLNRSQQKIHQLSNDPQHSDSTQAPQCGCIVKTHQVHRIQHIHSCKLVSHNLFTAPCSLRAGPTWALWVSLPPLCCVVLQAGARQRRAGFWWQIVTLEPIRLRKAMLQLIEFCRKRDPELEV